jgi:hypothetical protein
VEGVSPYTLAPGVHRPGNEADESSDSEEGESGVAPGTVFRLAKGRLLKLEGGMEQYGEMAARTAGKLAASK